MGLPSQRPAFAEQASRRPFSDGSHPWTIAGVGSSSVSPNPPPSLWGAAPVVILEADASGMVVRATGGGLTRHGGPGAFMGRPLAAFFARSPQLLRAVQSGGPGTPMQSQTSIDRVPYTVWVYAASEGVLVVATEGSARPARAGDSGQAQRLQSLGRLAGGIAHDFNNVLMAVMGHAQLIERRARDDGIRRAAATIVTAAERAAGLTDQLLGFARQGKLRKEPAVIDALVAEVCRLLARTLDRKIRVVHRPSPLPAVVHGDPAQLQQVILNLALNARDAMPDGGELVFATDIVEEAPTSAEVTSDLLVDTFVKLAVTDTGAGMTEDIRARVFEPYFTTKDVGEGHGLGLSMVYGIVRNHEGWIRVYSRPNEGSTFEVYLPLDRASLMDAPQPTDEPSLGRGHILIVDDEAMVRDAIRGLLERLGYQVTAVDQGAEAVSVFRAAPHRYDLVLMDLRMPGLSGTECLRQMRAIDPGLRAVLSSGYLPPKTVRHATAEGPTEFLAKPYTIGRLAEAVQTALRAEPV